jgi:DNA-binding MarR family transcriptional regulator
VESDERSELWHRVLGVDKLIFSLLRAGVRSEFLQVDLTMPQLKVMLLLISNEGEPLRMGQLAARMGVTLPTMTGIIDRLVEQGAVRRLEDPRDRRHVVVDLTELGRERVGRLITADRRRMEAVIGRLDIEDLRIVARAFDILYEAILQQTLAEQSVEARSHSHE